MEGIKMFAWSPLEVGDTVMAAPTPSDAVAEHVVTDILTVTSAKTGAVGVLYELDGNSMRPVRIDVVRSRVVDGREVPVGREQVDASRI